MTRVLILGGGGMVGQKLAGHLLAHGLPGAGTPDITLFDMSYPLTGVDVADKRVGDISDKATVDRLAADRFDLIYHLASIVSGEAEADFDKGWQTNLGSMMHLLEALRDQHLQTDGAYVPRLIFTSSIAVFGGPYPDKISDTFLQSPQTSYGAQKAVCEILLQDYSRKGFVNGLSLRLPTICVRPGKPNLAASSFFSGIIREPLNGKRAVLPVADSVRHWHASPRAAAGFLVHAATLSDDQIGSRRALNLPGVSCTVAEQIAALHEIAGQAVVDLIDRVPDPVIARIVAGWPQDFDAQRAIALGFQAEDNFAQIIQTYIADDLPQAR